MSSQRTIERVETVVIGGGQAGLAVGYELARRGLPFVILDAHERIGDAWRKRWDSLRLFTLARDTGLPGKRFPARSSTFPTKDQMADYLESYARQFALPVWTGVRVERLSRERDYFVVLAGPRRFEARQVVVAMANYQVPRVPAFGRSLAPEIVQLHSSAYHNPAQLREGGVLVVGVGNSGADIALEVAQTHATWLAGKESGHLPFRIETAVGRHVLLRLMRFMGHQVLSLRTPIGRRVRPRMLHGVAPLVRVKPTDLIAAGIERVPRMTGVQGGRPLLADGRVLDVTNVIWCTGFEPGFSWIDLPVFGDDGEPLHEKGIAGTEPGLYFVGLHFLYAMSSATVIGVGRDAARIANAIAQRTREVVAA